MWAEAIHRAFSSSRLSGQLLSVIRQAETALLVTEGDRRRLHVELTRAPKYEFPGLADWLKENP
jgi:hypothetical protein